MKETAAHRALCCPDKFRGSLTAREAAARLAEGFRDAGIADTIELPLADGGEGTLDALLHARGGQRREAVVTGPDRAPVVASWGVLPDGVAVIELAEASGLALVRGANDPISATTRGTGELIAIAAEAGATEVLLGVGGSATVDGGSDALEAIDWKLPVPVVVACDVDTRFVEAARVFAPQKGAGPAEVEFLTRRLKDLADRYLRETGVDVRSLPGSGAAGGIAGALAARGAVLRPGFDVISEAACFPKRLAESTLVVTGEGRLDHTTLAGKVVGSVLRAATTRSLPAGVVAGDAEDGAFDHLPPGTVVVTLASLAGSIDLAIARAAELTREAGTLVAGRLLCEPG